MYWGDTMAYNCLLIDFDETLVSFAESEKQCIAKVYNKYGIPVTEENLNFYHEINEKYWRDYENGKIKKGALEKARFQKVIEKFGVKNVSGDTMNKDYEHYLKFSAVVMDGALEFLQDVEDYVTIAIVTNGTEDTQNSRLKISCRHTGRKIERAQNFNIYGTGCFPEWKYIDIILFQSINGHCRYAGYTAVFAYCLIKRAEPV